MQLAIRDKNRLVIAHAAISPEYHDIVQAETWSIGGGGYVTNSQRVKLHTFMMGEAPEGHVWDHWDGDKLNNTKENLRIASFSQNSQNKPKKKNTKSKYIGVHYTGKKWRASIHKKKKYNLGLYVVELDAAKAYDKAALSLFGPQAKTNGLLTEEEVQAALVSQVEEKARKLSSYGRGILHNGFSFTVKIGDSHLGSFDTLEEAQKISKDFIDKREKATIEKYLKLPIQRNDDGNPVIPVRGMSGIVAYTLVNEHVWHDVIQGYWNLTEQGYVKGGIHGIKSIFLHTYIHVTYIGEIPKKYIVDHFGENHTDAAENRLDNRIENLRAVSRAVNSQNRIKTVKTSSRYLGVSKQGTKWIAQLQHNKVKHYLGIFDTEEEAALAYNKKVIELYGPTGKINIIQEIRGALNEN